jgi:hypothetical protein
MEISFIDRDGKPQSFIFPFNAMEAEYALAYYGENELKQTLQNADRTIVNSYMEQHFITPVKKRTAFLQKYLDKTADKIKAELSQEFISIKEAEEDNTILYKDLQAKIKSSYASMKQHIEMHDTEFKNNKEEHGTIYNMLFNDITSIHLSFKKSYELQEKQHKELSDVIIDLKNKVNTIHNHIYSYETLIHDILFLVLYIIILIRVFEIYDIYNNYIQPIVKYNSSALHLLGDYLG